MPQGLAYDIAHFRTRSALVRGLFASVAAEFAGGSVTLVEPEPAFCDAAECFVVRDGAILFFDGNHPSDAGAARLVPLILAALAERPGKPQQQADMH